MVNTLSTKDSDTIQTFIKSPGKIVAAGCNNQLNSQRWGCNQNGDQKVQIKGTNLCLEMNDCYGDNEDKKNPDIKINQCRTKSQHLQRFKKQQWK